MWWLAMAGAIVILQKYRIKNNPRIAKTNELIEEVIGKPPPSFVYPMVPLIKGFLIL